MTRQIWYDTSDESENSTINQRSKQKEKRKKLPKTTRKK